MTHIEGADAPRTPRYRFRAEPFGSDPSATLVQIRRVDGDPDGGPFGLRTSSAGDPLDAMVAALRAVIARLRAADDPGAAR